MDVLGFLSYEMVRALCERGLAVKRDYELARLAQGQNTKPKQEIHSSPSKKKRRFNASDGHNDDYDGSEAYKRPKPSGPFSGPIMSQPGASSHTPTRASFMDDAFGMGEGSSAKEGEKEGERQVQPEPPPAPEPVRSPLRVADVEDAYSMMQMGRVKTKTSALRNFTGAFVRHKVCLI